MGFTLLRIVDAKSSFLRLDKELRNSAIDPLKDGMIQSSLPDYKLIRSKVLFLHEEAVACYNDLKEKFGLLQWTIEERQSEEGNLGDISV
jgi:ferritin